MIITKFTIAVQLLKIGEQIIDMIQGAGTLGVAGNLYLLPGGQIRVDLPFGCLNLAFNGSNFARYVEVVHLGSIAKRIELLLQIVQGSLEFEGVFRLVHLQ